MRVRLASLGLALALASVAQLAAQNPEEFARRQYESGLTFMQNGRYAEALKDFQVVVDSFGQSSVADDALMQVALYYLDIAYDTVSAQAAADRLLKDYPNSDSAPMAYIIGGRLTMAKSRSAADVDTALASFERVPRLFPGSDAVAAARFYAGDTLRMARRTEDAVERFRRVSMEYPRSIWAARADLAMVSSLLATGRATQAFGRLQWIRQQFEGSSEATTALHYNTVLYRLYVRGRTGPAYSFSGRYIGSESSRFNDVMGIAVDDFGRVLLGHGQGVAIFDEKGALTRSIASQDPSTFFVDQRTRVVVVRRDSFIPDGANPIQVVVPITGRLPRFVEDIPAVVTLSNGDKIVSDRREKTVIRVSPAGRFVANFAAVNTERVTRNELDDVAMIDRDSKAIVVVDRDGKPLGRIAPRGEGYQINEPQDIAFGPLGHLFVLDRNTRAVYVFGARNQLVATLSSTGREAGALQRPRAIAVDAAGRLLVFDESSRRIQVYQ
ncbi:MAG: tetratricopeptide repeat protein [Acidobacteriota bacterium]